MGTVTSAFLLIPRSFLADRDQVMRKGGEHASATVLEKHVILDAHSAPSRPVDARLDGNDGVVWKRCFGRPRQPRRLMHLDADPVTEAMAERIAETAVFNVAPRDRVGIPSAHAGVNRAGGALVRLPNDRVDLTLLISRLSDDEGTRHIGAVATDDGAEVDQEKVPLLHCALG